MKKLFVVLIGLGLLASCGHPSSTYEYSNDYTHEENSSLREIDTSYTPVSIVEEFLSMLKFRDYVGAVGLFDYTVDYSDYLLKENAKQNEKVLNQYTPISYEIEDVELSPDGNRARIKVYLQKSQGIIWTVYYSVVKTEKYGWRLLSDFQVENRGNTASTNIEIINTKWKFSDAKGNNYVLSIKEPSSSGENIKAELIKNEREITYGTVEIKTKWRTGEFIGITFNFPSDPGNWSNDPTYISFSNKQTWFEFVFWDYSNGFLYPNQSQYEAEDANNRIKITKVK